MPTQHDRIAGRNLDRLAALADGDFAFSMTLPVRPNHAIAPRLGMLGRI